MVSQSMFFIICALPLYYLTHIFPPPHRISGAPNNPDSDVHIFTSHFMSTLSSDGAKAVSSWTAKKKINIFEKKLIFVPVNSDLHWSLCVVVNPGSIANNSEEDYHSKSLEGSL
jgi:Ulp1 family protease